MIHVTLITKSIPISLSQVKHQVAMFSPGYMHFYQINQLQHFDGLFELFCHNSLEMKFCRWRLPRKFSAWFSYRRILNSCSKSSMWMAHCKKRGSNFLGGNRFHENKRKHISHFLNLRRIGFFPACVQDFAKQRMSTIFPRYYFMSTCLLLHVCLFVEESKRFNNKSLIS